MTFLCPICKQVSSSKHKKFYKTKKGKGWREKSKERVSFDHGAEGLAFYCPCCKEARSLTVHNPFNDFKDLGHKKRKEVMTKRKLKKLPSHHTAPDKETIKEITAMTPEGLAKELDFTAEDVERAGYRVHHNANVSVSWDDTTEMRRLILKDVLMHAAYDAAVTIQCAARCWRAKARVQSAAMLKARKKKKRASAQSLPDQET